MSAAAQQLLFGAPPAAPRPVAPAIRLRPYQERALTRIKGAIRTLRESSKPTRVLCVAPTGAGKTVMFARLVAGAAEKGTPCTIVAHRAELLEQTWSKLLDAGIPRDLLGMVWADDRRANPRALVQVASVQTLARRVRAAHEGLVVVDEAHRALGASYQAIAADFPNAIHLGFTATPWRLDGQGMGAFYNSLVVVASVPELIGDGYLCEPRVFTHPVKPDLSKIKIKGGDYDERDLAKAVDTSVLVGNIVEHWLRLAQGARTLVFAASVEHSKNITRAFVETGIAAEHLDGSLSDADRRAVLARLSSGETRVVVNCQVLTEGFDCPSVKCVVLARPTKSRALFFQMVGRGMRPCVDVPELRYALVLDHAGCAHEHGLPQDPQDYSLEPGKRKRTVPAEAPVRTCEVCYAVAPTTATECPACGAPFPPRERVAIEEKAGELAELKATAERAAKLALVEQKKLRGKIQGWMNEADAARGWSHGTANGVLAARFGSRTRMDGAALARLWAWINAGEFDLAYPRPANTPPRAPAPAVRIVPPLAPFMGVTQAIDERGRAIPAALPVPVAPSWLRTDDEDLDVAL